MSEQYRVVKCDNPTLGHMLAMTRVIGRDRVSLVREPRVDREAGLVILLLSVQAIRECGPMLVEFGKETGPHDKSQGLIVSLETNLAKVNEWMDGIGQRFAYVSLSAYEVIVAFTGTELCGRIAVELERRGCPTSLE